MRVVVGVRVMLRVVVRLMVMGSVSRRLCVGRARAQQHRNRYQAKFVHRKKPHSRIEGASNCTSIALSPAWKRL
jgi:hypothetical protein